MNWRDFMTRKYFLILLIVVLLLAFSRQIATVLFPFVTGLIFAALLEPIIIFLEHRLRLPRQAAVMSTLVLSVSIAGYVLFAMTAKLISELINLTGMLPSYRHTIIDVTNDLFSQFERLNEGLPLEVRESFQDSLMGFLRTIEAIAKTSIEQVLAGFTSLPVFIAITVVIIVSTYFISKDKNMLIDFFMRLVPQQWQDRTYTTKERIAIDLMGFLKARILLLLIATVIAAGGLVLINTRYWLIIALIIGILDNIPIIGPGIIFAPWVITSLLLGDPDRAIFLTILYIVIFILRQLIEPKIMGDSVGIHPLPMLLALYGGIVFFGVMGIFIGPILLIVIKAAIHADLFKPTNFPE